LEGVKADEIPLKPSVTRCWAELKVTKANEPQL
jgi:hypothetical protein